MALLGALLCSSAAASDEGEERPDLTRLTIDELAAMRVVTVSRRPEARLAAAGAVHVITQEDVRRSGAATLPDALRLAPGLQASAIDANEWALTVRGFASRLSRSTQVLMDGRTLWTPLFAGVFWDAQHAVIEDVERIEVVRGPGGALFGANALNGIIHVISKDAAATEGGLATVAGGTAERVAALRWGDALGDATFYRVHGTYLHRDGTEPRPGPNGYDDAWRMLKAGARVDGGRGARDRFTVLADAYDGRSALRTVVGQFTPPFALALEGPVRLRGGNVLGRWTHAFSAGSEAVVSAYYDGARRTEPHFSFARDTVDLELQHRFAWGRHQTVWGTSYRASRGHFRGLPSLQLRPARRTDDIAGLFVHQDLQLSARWRAIAGAKLEWNDYSGWSLQPSGRLAWQVAPRHTLWASAARAVRTASRVEHDLLLYTPLSAVQPLFARVSGSHDFRPEAVVTWEAGYKTQPRPALYLDLTGFHSRYDNLASNEAGSPTIEPALPPEPPRTVIPVRIGNLHDGSATGVEATATATAGPRLRLQAAYSFLRVNQAPEPASTDRNEGFEGNSPRHQLWAASYLTAPGGVDLDLVLRRVGRIATHQVPAFTELDARVAFRPANGLELSVTGKNLLHRRHAEFGGGFEVERSVLGRVLLEW